MNDSFLNSDNIFGANEWLVQDLYQAYLKDPSTVSHSWCEYFEKNHKNFDSITNTNARAIPEVKTTKPKSFNLYDVTRSDLPPAPTSKITQPTSPYVARINQLKENKKIATNEDKLVPLKGIANAISKNMEESLDVPTATSVRDIPAKVMIENREIINRHLSHISTKKVSYTHIIGFAIVEALVSMPNMNVRYELIDSKPHMHVLPHVNFGLAIDIPTQNETRILVVPVIHKADTCDFASWFEEYNTLVKKARTGKLEPKDYMDTTITLTNPGTIGTSHSVPRLMKNQAAIIGIGSMAYPAQFAGTSDINLSKIGIGKAITITSTYDHRVIQGATSGEFLALLEKKLLGLDGFYNRVFASMQIPYEPVQWQTDVDYDPEHEMGKPARIAQLIHAYRSRGHLVADTDPLSYRLRVHPDLDFKSYGLTLWDLDRQFPTAGYTNEPTLVLRNIINYLRSTYTRSIGFEYMHIQDPVQREWIQEYIEQPHTKPSIDEQKHNLRILNKAEAFEQFLQTKYVGQKRFSLEGGESLIPLLDSILNNSSKNGVEEVVIGMPHRGRLNVLTNIAGKSYEQIFSEFEGYQNPYNLQGSGDVKYHLGTQGIYKGYDGKDVKVYLAANPSHLEAVDGVVEGITRAKQDKLNGEDSKNTIVPILIHGDSAFAGQGVVYETFNMSQLKAYGTGGTIHIIVNNQIGFTTGATSARSTNYCTDLAKGLQVPIFHINADDIEAVTYVGKLATLYRQAFNKDVIIDLVCYRKRGHNEGDDPSMTQPIMYSLIDKKPSTREIYAKILIDRKDISEEEYKEYIDEYNQVLEKIFQETKEKKQESETTYAQIVSNFNSDDTSDIEDSIDYSSTISEAFFKRICQSHVNTPVGMTLHPKVKKLFENRAASYENGNIDWGFAEILAFGSLLIEGKPVRITGQDARRATFVQRQAVVHDIVTGKEWTPIHSLTQDQASFEIYDSSLSEYAPLAFEYGYSVETPNGLTLWEAQFGDFVNGAQTVVDEFISSSEQKWGQTSGLVVLLPHGYEGQGPDHSSARIERFLQLCAQDNMIVCQPSTPANYFHLLREQAYRKNKKPLIAFTPKQLLRLKAASSSPEEFTSGAFQKILDESVSEIKSNPANVRRLVLCSGRIYYDLLAKREELQKTDIALVRVEQLYPLSDKDLTNVISKYSNAHICWVQDEPANFGPYSHLALNVFNKLDKPVKLISRNAAASPAAGTVWLHKAENEKLLSEVFDY